MNKRIKRIKRIARGKENSKTVFGNDDNSILPNYRCPVCYAYLAVPAESVVFGCDFYCWNCGQKLQIATERDRR